jgi:hypothetical protein
MLMLELPPRNYLAFVRNTRNSDCAVADPAAIPEHDVPTVVM